MLEEQKGVERKTVPRTITSKPVRTVNCGTVNRRYQAGFNWTGLEKDTAYLLLENEKFNVNDSRSN